MLLAFYRTESRISSYLKKHFQQKGEFYEQENFVDWNDRRNIA